MIEYYLLCSWYGRVSISSAIDIEEAVSVDLGSPAGTEELAAPSGQLEEAEQIQVAKDMNARTVNDLRDRLKAKDLPTGRKADLIDRINADSISTAKVDFTCLQLKIGAPKSANDAARAHRQSHWSCDFPIRSYQTTLPFRRQCVPQDLYSCLWGTIQTACAAHFK